MNSLRFLSFKNKMSTILFHLFVVLMITYFIFDVTISKYIATILGLMLFLLESRIQILKKYWPLYVITCLVVLGLLMEMFVTNSLLGINSFPLLFAHVGLVLFLLRRKVNLVIISIIFWFCVGYFVHGAISATDPNTILAVLSANHISTIMIFITVLFYISYLKSGGTPGLFPALMTFLICLWAPGLAGLIAGLILLIGVFLFVKKKKLDYAILAVALLGIFLYSQGLTINLSFHRESFNLAQVERLNLAEKSQYLYEEPRYKITKAYIKSLNFRTLLLGFDWPSQDYFLPGVPNLHSSYLQMHFRLGIFALFILMITAYALYKAFKKNRLYFVFLLAILVRAVTDTIMLPNGIFDFIFYYLLTSVICIEKTGPYTLKKYI